MSATKCLPARQRPGRPGARAAPRGFNRPPLKSFDFPGTAERNLPRSSSLKIPSCFLWSWRSIAARIVGRRSPYSGREDWGLIYSRRSSVGFGLPPRPWRGILRGKLNALG
jgi:hypothetical protein